jgi:hypothetical protein
VSLSPLTWTALAGGFVLIAVLLGVITIILVSQRQRTVMLTQQIATLLDQSSGVLKRADPVLDAQPTQSSTIASRAASAAALVTELRQGTDQPGVLAGALGNLDTLASEANRTGLVSGLEPLTKAAPQAATLISQTSAEVHAIQQADLLPRTLGGLDDLGQLLTLQKDVLGVLQTTLQTGRSTRGLTARALTTGRGTLATARQVLVGVDQLLGIGKQALTQIQELNAKLP